MVDVAPGHFWTLSKPQKVAKSALMLSFSGYPGINVLHSIDFRGRFLSKRVTISIFVAETPRICHFGTFKKGVNPLVFRRKCHFGVKMGSKRSKNTGIWHFSPRNKGGFWGPKIGKFRGKKAPWFLGENGQNPDILG